MSHRFQFSLAKLFVAVTLFCMTTFFVGELLEGCRSNSVSVWSYLAFCGIGGGIAAVWTMFRDSIHDALWVGIMFFVLAVCALPLFFAAWWGLAAGLLSLRSL